MPGLVPGFLLASIPCFGSSELTLTETGAVPLDFPREAPPSSLAGVQLKFSGRLVDGAFVIGRTADEVAQRHAACQDLLAQLEPYARGKLESMPGLTLQACIAATAEGVRRKDWGLSEAEVQWVSDQLRSRLEDVRV